jgi:hypothetical protein
MEEALRAKRFRVRPLAWSPVTDSIDWRHLANTADAYDVIHTDTSSVSWSPVTESTPSLRTCSNCGATIRGTVCFWCDMEESKL